LSNVTFMRRKEKGLCVYCGKDLQGKSTQCKECMRRRDSMYLSDRKKPQAENPQEHRFLKGIKNPNTKLDEDCKQAMEEGLSYGKWRMKKEMRERGEIT